MANANPNLMSKQSMTTMASTRGSGRLLYHEVLTKVNNAKDKTKKVEVLKQYDTPGLRRIIKGSFDPKIKWDLPEGIPPYIANSGAGLKAIIASLSDSLKHHDRSYTFA